MAPQRIAPNRLALNAVVLISCAAGAAASADTWSNLGDEGFLHPTWDLDIAPSMLAEDPDAPTSPGDESGQLPADELETYEEEADLAQQLQNPVASLISVPFQFNLDRGIGPKNSDQVWVNIQPVLPFSINDDWNLISRTILPVIYAESPADGIESEFGLGDTLQSFFFSPKEPIGGWILGFGPVAQIPTGTDDRFRTDQLSLGPTGLALRQDPIGAGVLTYGMLVNHVWDVVEVRSDADPVNATFLQPFLAYTLKTGTTFGLNTESTYNWRTEQWTIPFNLSVAQVARFGTQPVQFQFAGRYYAEGPSGGPEWGLRFTVTFLFPR